MKPVPLAPILDPATRRLGRSGASALSGVEEAAVETALRLRDAWGGEVVLVSMVPEGASEALRPALAMGADRALVVTSERLAGADVLVTSSVLAAAVRSLEVDLVVLGASSGDGNGALLWSALGERLGMPAVSRAVEASVVDGRLRARRQMESGIDVVTAELPAVLAISGEICVPRYPSFKDVIAAKRKVVDLVTPASFGLTDQELGEHGARTRVLTVASAPARGRAEIVDDDGHAHERVVEFLRERRLV